MKEWFYSLDIPFSYIISYLMKVDFLRQNLVVEFERKRMILSGKQNEKQQVIAKLNKRGM